MQEPKDTYFPQQTENNDTFNIREELEKYLIHWKWFVLGIFIAMLGAFLYLRYTTPQYIASTSIMIKDNQKSGISDELKAVADLGIVGTGSTNNPDNEIEVLKSRKIIGNVVDSLLLEITYFIEGRVKKSELYTNKPFEIIFVDRELLNSRKDTSFVVSVIDRTSFNFLGIEGNVVKSSKFNEPIFSAIGTFIVYKAEEVDKYANKSIYIHFRNRNRVIDSYKSRINVNPVNKNSSVLNISLQDPLKDKAEDILDELVKQYNLDAIKDNSTVSDKTKTFIEDRLKSVGLDLANIQDDVKKYKTKFGITGLSKEGELALQAVSENNKLIAGIQSQLSLANWIQKKLTKESEENDVLPTNLGFTDASITTSIQEYNELVLDKNKLLVTAGKRNPQLIEVQKRISTLNANLLSSLENLKKSLEIQLVQLNKEAKKAISKIATIPSIEREMIDIERQKEIYAELYSYLLKKKEETAISLAVTVPNAKIIDYAYSNGLPVSPKKNIIYFGALLLGIVFPFFIIYIKNILDTKIHSRKDIEELTSLPF